MTTKFLTVRVFTGDPKATDNMSENPRTKKFGLRVSGARGSKFFPCSENSEERLFPVFAPATVAKHQIELQKK